MKFIQFLVIVLFAILAFHWLTGGQSEITEPGHTYQPPHKIGSTK